MCAFRAPVSFDERKIDAIFREVDQCHLPGAVAGIAIDGKPVYRKGFGMASAELPVALSPAMRMRIGSTTKHFACFAYLLLCAEGKAAVDDPIGKYIPELHPVARAVTLRQLMGNISGLRDVHDILWQFNGRGHRVTSEELLSLYCDINDVNATPQTNWIYCNGGFLLLSIAIERITGRSLETVLWERVFKPVGMYDSLLRRWDTDFVPNSATLHMTTRQGGFERWYMGTALAGEGGMVSTVDDLLRWLAHMDSPTVGDTATWALMKEPQTLLNGLSTAYGLGLFVGRYRGIELLHHPGGVMGGNAQMLKVPAAGLDVTVIVNRHDVSAQSLAKRVLDACLPTLEPLNVVPQRLLPTGVFRSPTTGRVLQLFAKEGRQIAAVNGVDLPVESDRREVISAIADAENPPQLRFDYFGNVDELVRLPPPNKADASVIDSRYRSETTGVEITIEQSGQTLQLISVGRFGSVVYELECLAAGLWRAWSSHPTLRGGIFSSERGGAQLCFSNDRIWNLPFHV